MRAVAYLSLFLSHLLLLNVCAEECEKCPFPYTFAYYPAEAGTQAERVVITSADGSSLVSLISKDLLSLTIQSYDSQGFLQLEKLYIWDEKQRLFSIEVREGQQQHFYQRTYLYDSFGNPILETFLGEDTQTIKREFSQDGRNLLLQEENEEGKVVIYEYLPNTNLVTAKLTYDERGNAIQAIVYEADGQLAYILEKEYTDDRLASHGENKRIAPALETTHATRDINSHLYHLIVRRGECRDLRDPMGKDKSDAYEQQQIDNAKLNEGRDNIKRHDPPRDNREVLPQYGNRPSPQERKDRPLRDAETEQLIHELYQRAKDEESKANAHFLEALLLLEQVRPIAAVIECGAGGGHMQAAINLNTEAAIIANTGNTTKTTSNQNK